MSFNPTSQAWQCPGAKVPCYVFDSGSSLAHHVAQMIASLVRERNALGRPTVLGLPTGSTPVGTYRELVRLHKAEDLDFSNVITFNLDEYYQLDLRRSRTLSCLRCYDDAEDYKLRT